MLPGPGDLPRLTSPFPQPGLTPCTIAEGPAISPMPCRVPAGSLLPEWLSPNRLHLRTSFPTWGSQVPTEARASLVLTRQVQAHLWPRAVLPKAPLGLKAPFLSALHIRAPWSFLELPSHLTNGPTPKYLSSVLCQVPSRCHRQGAVLPAKVSQLWGASLVWLWPSREFPW